MYVYSVVVFSFVSIGLESDPKALPQIHQERQKTPICSPASVNMGAVFLQLEAGRWGETGVSGTDGDWFDVSHLSGCLLRK